MTVINYSILIIFGIIMGFLSAIPIGAVQLQVIRKSLRGLQKAAIATVLGSTLSDLIYGALALLGIGEFLLAPRFQFYFYLLGAAVLVYLLSRLAHEYRHPVPENDSMPEKKQHFSFVTGFILAIINPSMILWWLMGFKLFLDMDLFNEITIAHKIIFILCGCSGLAGYLMLIAGIIHRIHRNISDKIFRRLNLVLIIVLCGLAAYFIFKVVMYLLP